MGARGAAPPPVARAEASAAALAARLRSPTAVGARRALPVAAWARRRRAQWAPRGWCSALGPQGPRRRPRAARSGRLGSGWLASDKTLGVPRAAAPAGWGRTLPRRRHRRRESLARRTSALLRIRYRGERMCRRVVGAGWLALRPAGWLRRPPARLITTRRIVGGEWHSRSLDERIFRQAEAAGLRCRCWCPHARLPWTGCVVLCRGTFRGLRFASVLNVAGSARHLQDVVEDHCCSFRALHILLQAVGLRYHPHWKAADSCMFLQVKNETPQGFVRN
jgi:hypothetical protein